VAMIGLGTLVNTGAIVAGGLIGLFAGKLFCQAQQDSIGKACGVSTMFIAIAGAMSGMLKIEDGALTSGRAMLVVLCLALGTVLGELLGIEDAFERLRYEKVVLATDADVDGLHIRNLLLTFFLQYFESLVISGHLYIFETPLFRVRNKETTFYCYSEQERDDRAKELGKSAEITRFKGLGEISPKEFKQFLGSDIRLEKVSLENTKGIHEMLRFYMGSNDETRWEHIQNNLV
jgi:DNA gyrase/topoisomerase IV subunit B